MFRVFLGAPSNKDIRQNPTSYHWQTVSSISQSIPASQPPGLRFPPATLEAASRRISLIYQNIIFDESEDEEEPKDNPEDREGGLLFPSFCGSQTVSDMPPDQTTMITWPPTLPQDNTEITEDGQLEVNAPSFLDVSKSRAHTDFETQETQETESYNYSDASSIARFPAFHFNLHALTALSSLSHPGIKGSRKVNVLLAALEVEGPDTIRIKKGPDAGKEVSILKMILGDEEGSVCKLTAWREVAETWGGAGNGPAAKRGDILFIENVTASYDPSTFPTLTASPYLKSKLEICYRTMAYTHEDNRLRPDLRLGNSDAAVRKVVAVVAWFEGMAGLGV